MKLPLTSFAVFLITQTVWAGEVFALDMIGVAGGANFNIQGKSFAERRFSTVYRQ